MTEPIKPNKNDLRSAIMNSIGDVWDRAKQIDDAADEVLDLIEADRQANNPESLTPAEAVFAFAAWLTSREQPVIFGSAHGAAIAADLASEFTESQRLKKFREDFHKRLMPYPSESAGEHRQANKITGETSDGYHTFNELYAHRVRLFCLLMHAHKNNAWWSRKHHDGSAWEGWIVAGIDTPEGTSTYHLPESEIENLPEGTELPNGKEWDGHTAADVLVRLLSLRQVRQCERQRKAKAVIESEREL